MRDTQGKIFKYDNLVESVAHERTERLRFFFVMTKKRAKGGG